MTTKEFIKNITTYEFMWRTNDVSMIESNGVFYIIQKKLLEE